ncbi:MAG: UMP kinase [Nanobdellota archaeon]
MNLEIISLGGSIVAPDGFDLDYVKRFRDMILGLERQAIIVVGGGSLAREYIKLADNDEDADWLGIMATRLNAEAVRAVFGEKAYKKVIYDPTEKVDTNKIIIAAGYKPGWSTDMVSALFAETYGSKDILNITNTDYVYDKDPRRFKDAEKIEMLSWDRMEELFGEFRPGLNSPFDPVASKKAREKGMRVVITSKDIDNIKAYFKGKEYKGTTIE